MVRAVRAIAGRHLHVVDVVRAGVSWRFEVRRSNEGHDAGGGVDGELRRVSATRD